MGIWLPHAAQPNFQLWQSVNLNDVAINIVFYDNVFPMLLEPIWNEHIYLRI